MTEVGVFIDALLADNLETFAAQCKKHEVDSSFPFMRTSLLTPLRSRALRILEWILNQPNTDYSNLTNYYEAIFQNLGSFKSGEDVVRMLKLIHVSSPTLFRRMVEAHSGGYVEPLDLVCIRHHDCDIAIQLLRMGETQMNMRIFNYTSDTQLAVHTLILVRLSLMAILHHENKMNQQLMPVDLWRRVLEMADAQSYPQKKRTVAE